MVQQVPTPNRHQQEHGDRATLYNKIHTLRAYQNSSFPSKSA